MIELNLTYEESKKILELGYDFSKICDFAWVTMNTNETPVLVCQNSEIQYLLFAQKICDFQTALIKKQAIEIIPIIPKAALEACLPDIVDAYHGDLIWYTPRNPPEYRLCRDGDSVTSLLLEEFDSIYEAFIWCHEHHPKELKRKFKEVMK